MTKLIIIVFIFLTSCNHNIDGESSKFGYPSKKELKYKIGDCLYFKTSDSTYGCVVVCDFSKDVGGIWYGTFYSSYESSEIPTTDAIKSGKVMGRKIVSPLEKKGYQVYLDGDFIVDSLFTNRELFNLIGNINIKKVALGAYGAATSMQHLRISFKRGKEIRMKPPDHYNEHLTKFESFHPEEYFEMKAFEK